MQQLVHLGHVADVGGRALHVVHQPRILVHTNVRLHPEVPLVDGEAYEQHRKEQVWTLELSAQLDIDVYQGAWAEVVVYNGMDFSAAPLVDQRLSEN